ncbi:MAG TPA: hypothetical protein VGS28_00415 [Candidatus Saccharimonadales bacterium]|nr:hypothetical protein [Candidatus Saccharimonadales bacterium]
MRKLTAESINSDRDIGFRPVLDVGFQMARVVRGASLDELRAAIGERFPGVDSFSGGHSDLQRGVRLAEAVIVHTKRQPESHLQRQAGVIERPARDALLELAADPGLTSDLEVRVGEVGDYKAEKSWGTDRRGKLIGWRIGGLALDMPELDGLLSEQYELTCRALGRVVHRPFRSPLMPFALIPVSHPDPQAATQEIGDFVRSQMTGKQLTLGPVQYDSFPLLRRA